jgi:hypothetical protein
MMPAAAVRLAELRARCEVQRQLLGGHVSDIEDRLRSTDWLLGTLRKAISRPAVMIVAIALVLAVGRKGAWSKLSRAVALFIQARRIYSMLKEQ